MRWGFSSWDAGAAAVLANQTGQVTINYPECWHPTISYQSIGGQYAQRDSLGTITVSAGDIVHMEIYRNGGHVDDDFPYDGNLYLMEAEYTADS